MTSLETHETSGPYVFVQKIAAAGTQEALTTRSVRCRSITFIPEGVADFAAATGRVYVIDGSKRTASLANDDRFVVPSGGLTLALEDPEVVFIDAAVNGEGVRAVAV